ncbi:unnamed protein product [Paramecium primaurelia]|uniref:Uncharacterized protein n=1 Tax=Paramecium primaurelia TaxID=5886 RepID=A0A8S1LWG6_PARPR|nr:unnamed protein product [Paramecium primaurelia]
MDNSIPIIRKKSNLTDQPQEKNRTIPPMINCDKLITNLQKITLMDILDQFAKDSESKSIVEILRSIFEIAEKPHKVQDKTQIDLWSINNYKDNQKFEFNDEQKNKQNGYDYQNTKKKDHRYRDLDRGRDNDKNYHNDRHDRYDRQDKYDRNEKRTKYDNNDRYERYDRHDKYQKYDRRDNYDKYANENKGRRDYHKNDHQNETNDIRNDWIIKIPDTIINGQQINGKVDNFNQPNMLSIATPK